jgi:phosphoserine phosphatase RsbU/P
VTTSKTAGPGEEAARLAAVRRYEVLDTPEDGAFDRITALAARHFGVPIAIVSIVDRDRIWFKSHHGVGVREVSRDPGLCASAIMHDGPWVIEDAALDPRTLANPLVAADLGLRFYAGVPLTTQDGFNLGTLCVIDREPRVLDDEDMRTLRDMAGIVMDELELRLASRHVVQSEQTLREQAEHMARTLQESLLPPQLPAIANAQLAALYLPASYGEVGGDFYDVLPLPEDTWALVIGDVSGKGAHAAAVTALARHTIRTAFLTSRDPADVLATLNRAMFLGLQGGAPEHFCTVLVAVLGAGPDGFALELSAAGHPPALLMSGAKVEELARAGGPPVGWRQDVEFASAHAELRGGDALVLYTDGLSESRTPAGMLGVEGIIEAIEAGSGQDATALVDRLADLLVKQASEVRDDAAALILTTSQTGDRNGPRHVLG